MSKINRLYELGPFPGFNQKILSVKGEPKGPTPSFDRFKRSLDLGEFVMQLHYRTVDAGRSFAYMQYFYRLGIPDDQWYISPGKKGQSIEYLPHFKPIHHRIKDWFDYYADFFFYKIFSGFDMIGQILNAYYDLGLTGC